MNTSDPMIEFDDEGICNHCHAYDKHFAEINREGYKEEFLSNLAETIKRDGSGKDYDCILGLSGGVDSSYLAWFTVKKLRLRPLVIHVDTGWNSELAVNNIKNILEKLNLDLHTIVINWEEIRDLQRAYFLSGVANLDVPQDHAFVASLYKAARKFGISHILNGNNMQTECTLPSSWGYDASDSISLRAIHKKFGQKKLKTFPIMSPWQRYIYYPYVLKLKIHSPLEYIEYSKEKAKKLLTTKYGWRDYGGKHYESTFTKFFQAHYLPTKFGYDKRLAHMASLVTSGQMTRQQAMEELQKPIYAGKELKEDKIYWVKKLELTMEQYSEIMNKKPVDYKNYPNGEKLHECLRKIKKIGKKIIKNFV